ncbi:hypothetical protein LARV_03018 [Longilinea arvoryzae]|uniref:Uncharacterized protein n=1 Tax=Longilinea arvoryzae TaxID=360412 RepID=A0A0S7BM04_9CHLR|nr:hypothetical protein [Longilinea arvoryzae]GAP15234.1 hypothetical protein LARV_03018 [Longilinea arvoryzae]
MEFKPVVNHSVRAQSQHRRQRFLQIWLPLGLAVTVVLGGAVWAAVAAGSPGASLTKYADISAIWLILPLCLVGGLSFLLLGLMIYLTGRAYHGLPDLDRKVQAVFSRIESGVRRAADQSVRPIYTVNSWSASWKAFFDRLFQRRNPQ